MVPIIKCHQKFFSSILCLHWIAQYRDQAWKWYTALAKDSSRKSNSGHWRCNCTVCRRAAQEAIVSDGKEGKAWQKENYPFKRSLYDASEDGMDSKPDDRVILPLSRWHLALINKVVFGTERGERERQRWIFAKWVIILWLERRAAGPSAELSGRAGLSGAARQVAP